jgi:hypothetical protein
MLDIYDYPAIIASRLCPAVAHGHGTVLKAIAWVEKSGCAFDGF